MLTDTPPPCLTDVQTDKTSPRVCVPSPEQFAWALIFCRVCFVIFLLIIFQTQYTTELSKIEGNNYRYMTFCEVEKPLESTVLQQAAGY